MIHESMATFLLIISLWQLVLAWIEVRNKDKKENNHIFKVVCRKPDKYIG